MDVIALVKQINETRPAAKKPILETAKCDFCGEDFAIQPQDKARIQKVRAHFCCWNHECRKFLKKVQNNAIKVTIIRREP